MNSEQLSVRSNIIHQQKIPENIDILLINAACETGINIKNTDISFIIIGSRDKDTITQVRGRLRSDLNLLIIITKDVQDTPNPIPEEYLNRPLTSNEKESLCIDVIRYLSPKGVPYKWKAVKPYLESSGYKITDRIIKNGIIP